MRRLVSAIAGLVLSGSALQSLQAQLPGRVPIPYRSYIAVNPLGIPFDIISAEFESGIAQGITVGGIGSYTDLDDKQYRTVEAKFRYYPSEVVLQGLSFGVSLGTTRFSNLVDLGTGGRERETGTYSTLGFLTDYNWNLGYRRRFLVGTGIGAKRTFSGKAERARLDISQPVLTMRFVVGLAF